MPRENRFVCFGGLCIKFIDDLRRCSRVWDTPSDNRWFNMYMAPKPVEAPQALSSALILRNSSSSSRSALYRISNTWRIRIFWSLSTVDPTSDWLGLSLPLKGQARVADRHICSFLSSLVRIMLSGLGMFMRLGFMKWIYELFCRGSE